MSVSQPICVFCSASLTLRESRAAAHCSRPACSWKYATIDADAKVLRMWQAAGRRRAGRGKLRRDRVPTDGRV